MTREEKLNKVKALDEIMEKAFDEKLMLLDTPVDEPDPIVTKVIESYKKRSEEGIRKYGTTLERNDLNFLDWLNHLQEELMDATLYIERLKSDVSEPYDITLQGNQNAVK